MDIKETELREKYQLYKNRVEVLENQINYCDKRYHDSVAYELMSQSLKLAEIRQELAEHLKIKK